MCIDGLYSLIMDVSAFLTERFLTENSPNSWTNVRQIHFCVGCNILSTVSYLKENRAPHTSKHILVGVTNMHKTQLTEICSQIQEF